LEEIFEEEAGMDQLEVVSLGELVSGGHNYRKFKKLLDFESINKHLKFLKKKKAMDSNVYLNICFYNLDLSDRELGRYLSENNAAKWFCDFRLTERTPDYSLSAQFARK
jgi:hypothetical protein